MLIDILTLFPTFYESPISIGIINNAIKNKKINLNIVNMRNFGEGNYKRCDDYPYGGGAGMVMTPQPLHDAITAVDPDRKFLRIYFKKINILKKIYL